jgi:hypothetical protein
MKAIVTMTIVALFSTALTGCWFYSRPDTTASGCQKTTYGLAIAAATSENCPQPASADGGITAAPPAASPTGPPLPSPGTM